MTLSITYLILPCRAADGRGRYVPLQVPGFQDVKRIDNNHGHSHDTPDGFTCRNDRATCRSIPTGHRGWIEDEHASGWASTAATFACAFRPRWRAESSECGRRSNQEHVRNADGVREYVRRAMQYIMIIPRIGRTSGFRAVSR
jgi:hypothetical protein